MCSGAPSVRKTRPAPHRRAQWGWRGTACGGGRPRPRRAGRVAHTHPLHSRAHDLPAHRALYLEPSLGMETCISGLSATQTKEKKKRDKKNELGSSAEPKQQTRNEALPMDGFLRRTSLLLQKQSARGTRFSPCSDKDNVSGRTFGKEGSSEAHVYGTDRML